MNAKNKLSSFLIFYVFFTTSIACAQDFLWAKKGGGAGCDISRDITTDSQNNIIITGDFEGTAYFNSTPLVSGGNGKHIFLAKYNMNGIFQWVIQGYGPGTLGGSEGGYSMGHGVVVDQMDNIIFTGHYINTVTFGTFTLPRGGANVEFFIAKYDPSGNVIWAKAGIGSYGVAGYDIIIDNVGNSYVTGFFGHHNFGGNMNFDAVTLSSPGGNQIFIAKIDPNGNLVWIRQAGSSVSNGKDVGTAISFDSFGNVIVTGTFLFYMITITVMYKKSGILNGYLTQFEEFVAKRKALK